jgi:hypothetical protein
MVCSTGNCWRISRRDKKAGEGRRSWKRAEEGGEGAEGMCLLSISHFSILLALSALLTLLRFQ